VPPFKVLNNSVLLDLTKKPPKSQRELLNRPGVSYRVARNFAGDIMKTIADARRQDPSVLEPSIRNSWRAPSRAAKIRLEMLKAWRIGKARELGLQVGVVFPANLLENLAAAPPENPEELGDLPGMRQWRVREFGEEILQLLQSQEAQDDTSTFTPHQVS
jgi:ribonuclease D